MQKKEDKAAFNRFEQISALRRCSICFQLRIQEDLYYEYKCERFICVDHFLGCDLQGRTFQLPCGHSQDIQDVKIFTKDFCRKCRKNYPRSGLKFTNYCNNCRRQTSQNKNKKSSLDVFNQKIENVEREIKESINESPLERVTKKDQQIQKLRNILEKERRKLEVDKEQLNKQRLRMNSKIQEYASQEHKIEIAAKDNEIEKLRQQLKVSTYIRNQLKGLILTNDRDVDCPICFQNFDLEEKKPLMICWQQHLICEYCFNRKWTGRTCPLCRQPIERSKALVSRQKSRSLQIQKIVTTKNEKKVQELKKRQNDENLPLLAWSVSNQEIQTDTLVEQAKPAKRVRQKKQTVQKPIRERAKKGGKKSPSPKVQFDELSKLLAFPSQKDAKVEKESQNHSLSFSQRSPDHSSIVSKQKIQQLKKRGERLNASLSKQKSSGRIDLTK